MNDACLYQLSHVVTLLGFILLAVGVFFGYPIENAPTMFQLGSAPIVVCMFSHLHVLPVDHPTANPWACAASSMF